VKVGFAENTKFPVPVSSPTIAAISEEVLMSAAARKPSVEVEIHEAVEPFDWRSWPFVPSDEALSRSELIFKTPEVVAFVAIRFVTVVVAVSVGPAENTATPPVPVSSPKSAANSEDVSIEVDESLPLKSVQSEAERRPRAVFALAVGMFNVCTPPADAKPHPPAFEVVANVCEDWVWPLRDVIALERRPSEDVATHVAVLPLVCRIMPLEPRDEELSRRPLILSTVVVAEVRIARVEKRFVFVALVKTPFIAKKLVEVAFVVVEVVAVNELIAATPERVGLVLKTKKPVPVSSVTMPASFDDESSEVVAIFWPKVVQSAAVRRPRDVAPADGMLKVCTPPVEVIAKSVPAVVDAKVCED
jgi:hypothetical protein